MYYTLLFGITLTYYASAELNRIQVSSKFSQSSRNGITNSKNNAISSNMENDTKLEKIHNVMSMPSPFEDAQVKKKYSKKHPKSTIQKIIARKRKNKKLMQRRLTSKPTPAPASDDLIEEYVPERSENPTTQAALKKKVKKWNNKVTKYHGQVQKMQPRVNSKNKRSKRNTERDNTIVLQDFDEMEFLERKKDYDIVNTHYKKYW